MPRFVPLPAPAGHSLPDLQEALQEAHTRMRRIEPSISRVAFVSHDRDGDGLLRTDLCHDPDCPDRCFEPRSLASLPTLRALGQRREARVIDDLLLDLDRSSPHNRWLLEQGWRSSLTLPLVRRGSLLGFLFVNAARPAAFGSEVLDSLQPLLDPLLRRIGDHLGAFADLHALLAWVVGMVALRDPPTGAHLERVARYSELIALELQGDPSMPEGFAAMLGRFAPLHDVGKLGIPDRILLKPGMLDPQEVRQMRSHVAIGITLIERLLQALQLSEEPAGMVLRQVVAHHHECLDGSGYPCGLRDAEVSLAGRIVAVADIYDSLTQERPYKVALADAQAVEILRGLVRGGKLDRRCVEALLGRDDLRAPIRAHRHAPAAADLP